MAFWWKRDGYQDALRTELTKTGTSGRVPPFATPGRARVGTPREVTGSASVTSATEARTTASFTLAALTDATLVGVADGDPADPSTSVAATLAAVEIERMAKEELRGGQVVDGLRAALRRAHARIVDVRARIDRRDGEWWFDDRRKREKRGFDTLLAHVSIAVVRGKDLFARCAGSAEIMALGPGGFRLLGAPHTAPLGAPELLEPADGIERFELAEGERVVACNAAFVRAIGLDARRLSVAAMGPIATAAALATEAAEAVTRGPHSVAVAIPRAAAPRSVEQTLTGD